MQLKSPLAKQDVIEKLEKVENESEELSIRIGVYYSKLKTNQKKRFNSIVKAICKKFVIYIRKHPLEMILVRQIALNTIRIEEVELALMEGAIEKYSDAKEKWLFSAQKERRDAMTTLQSLLKVGDNRKSVGNFDKMRDLLRDEEDLPPAKPMEKTPDGHDRRAYDKITRIEK